MNDRKNLTEGSIFKKLLIFAIPIMLTNLLQTLYNVADMAIVGHFLGSSGMSAVNISGQITNIVMVIVTGLANGGSIMISQAVGRNNRQGIPNLIRTMITAYSILALFFTALLYAIGNPLLHLIETPAEAFEGAQSYLFICLIGTLFVYVYNCYAAAYRGSGDSLKPMLFVLITVVLNVGLDYLFVGPLGMGVKGAALATILAQIICAVIVVINGHTSGVYRLEGKILGIDFRALKVMLKIGIFQALQFSLTSISYLAISGLINEFGVIASAATGAVNKVGSFAMIPGMAFQIALMTFTAQNMPSKNWKRIIKGMFAAMSVSVFISLVFVAIGFIWPQQVLGIFTTETSVIEAGTEFLKLILISHMVEAIMFCLYGIISGSGHTNFTFYNAIISAFIVRLTLSFIFTKVAGMALDGIGLAYICAPLVTSCVSTIYLLTGKWKKPRASLKVGQGDGPQGRPGNAGQPAPSVPQDEENK